MREVSRTFSERVAALYPHGRVERVEVPRGALWAYVRQRRPWVAATAPLLYWCVIPLLLLDLSISLYQAVCFPVYQVPAVRRADHFHFDRSPLPYLNALEKLHCLYCSYATGMSSYFTEIAGRTEQHWCPIRHAAPLMRPHSRYGKFLAYNNAFAYRKGLQRVRTDFQDIQGGSKEAKS